MSDATDFSDYTYKGKTFDEIVDLWILGMLERAPVCKALGVVRSTLWREMKKPGMKAAYEMARDMLRDDLTSALYTMAVGIRKYDDEGKMIGWIVEPQPACLIFASKTILKLSEGTMAGIDEIKISFNNSIRTNPEP